METGCLLTILAMFLVIVLQVVLATLHVIAALYPDPSRQSCCAAVEVAKENETVVNGFSQTN